MSRPMTDKDMLRSDWLDCPKPERFGPDHACYEEAMAAHRLAVDSDQPGYIDPASSLFVMTADHLRGSRLVLRLRM